MSDESKPRRGEVAWREQRDAISKRNAEARKRGRTERESRESLSAARLRVAAQSEAEQLRKLNVQIARRQRGSG